MLKRVQHDAVKSEGRASQNPPRLGEGDRPQDGGGARAESRVLSAFGIPACVPPPAALVPLPVPERIWA